MREVLAALAISAVICLGAYMIPPTEPEFVDYGQSHQAVAEVDDWAIPWTPVFDSPDKAKKFLENRGARGTYRIEPFFVIRVVSRGKPSGME